ncbi:MFS transporter [Rhizobium halophytocola]|uniref:MFS family permease n=1 Tax=Rhizobium halophytocola TaxID=735519 RepID=A0ABS4E4X2_9HYPH|nr:MFS transporter [Rhizobium halophytocola]MBP1853002.1 MFS family permease [Rhizobium halophytocola]
MFQPLSIVLRSAPIRASALTIFFFGFAGAATSPYMSLIGIRELGFSDAHYSLLIFLAAVVNVSASILAGILSDRMGDYRRSMLIACLFGISGYGLIFFIPNASIFVFAMLCMVPIFGTLNSLIFAQVRASSKDVSARELVTINSAIRSMISLSWVLVPGLVGFYLAGQKSMLPAFLIAALACAACLLLILTLLPRDVTPSATNGGLAIFAALKIVGSPQVLLRVIAVSLVSAMMHVNAAVLPLVVTGRAHGTSADVGNIVGIVAFLEVVFIIFWGMLERRVTSLGALAAGTVFYGAYLILLSFVTDTSQVYALTLLSGLGAAAIISIPITYVQNLIADRAGLGSSLIAVNVFISGGLGSLIFAIGTAVSDYAGTALLAALVGLAGIALLVFFDVRERAHSR